MKDSPAQNDGVTTRRGIVFLAWGDDHIQEMHQCLLESQLPDYPIYLITDETTEVPFDEPELTVVRVSFSLHGRKGHAKKCELGKHLPPDIDTFLFLDVDTRVLGDISLGFEKAAKHGIAMAQAAHYSMDHFKGFGEIMEKEGVARQGQLLYNSGVFFFSLTPPVTEVLDLWLELASRHSDAPFGDQAYLSLAMEILGFNPYTLSTGYNHRGFGELISGDIRIWHSYQPVPENVNSFESPFPRLYSKVDGQIVPLKWVLGRKVVPDSNEQV